MHILLSGASQHQKSIIQFGDLSEIDFRTWNPVKLKAYIGSSREEKTNSDHSVWTSRTIGI